MPIISPARSSGSAPQNESARYLLDIENLGYELVPHPLDLNHLVLVVTGAHPRAESCDRPLAYRLREAILEWRDRNATEEPPFDVLVISDVWRLNNEELHATPTISVGGPGVNALSANLADKIPSAFVIENSLIVQIDLDFQDFRVACWGVDHGSTIAAVDVFIDRYLDIWLSEVVQRMD